MLYLHDKQGFSPSSSSRSVSSSEVFLTRSRSSETGWHWRQRCTWCRLAVVCVLQLTRRGDVCERWAVPPFISHLFADRDRLQGRRSGAALQVFEGAWLLLWSEHASQHTLLSVLCCYFVNHNQSIKTNAWKDKSEMYRLFAPHWLVLRAHLSHF